MKRLLVLTISITVISCNKEKQAPPLFVNSIVSTDIDFIHSDDPSSFETFEYLYQDIKEMPDKNSDELIDSSAFVFLLSFNDGDELEIWANSDFETIDSAEFYVEKLTDPLGKLPSFMRQKINHVVLHKGDETAFAESAGHFFMMYSENILDRIATNDIEETVFHESVHASFEIDHIETNAWKRAQKKDAAFVTEYGQDFPIREDMAESAIFVYTLIYHPDRLSSETRDWLSTNLSKRIDFFEEIF